MTTHTSMEGEKKTCNIFKGIGEMKVLWKIDKEMKKKSVRNFLKDIFFILYLLNSPYHILILG